MNTLPSWAQQLARALLHAAPAPPLGPVQGVAAGPQPGARSRPGRRAAGAAAWLRDIGYAPGLAITGLRRLDGARYLRDTQRADAMLCRLVAHHSCAIIEPANADSPTSCVSEFDPAPDALASVLTCCDMTTSPDGQPVPVDWRLAEIRTATARGTW